MKKQIKEIYQMIRGNLRGLLLFEFFFRFIAGTLLVQVLSLIHIFFILETH